MVNAEPAFILVFLATFVVVACLPGRSMEAARRRLDAIAERRSLAILLVALLSLLANGVFAWRHGMPVPSVSDEFAHLLGADTFCEGRLTNPPHPMWKHFETEGVIQEPTYQSKYPPAHSMTLAGGRMLTGQAIAGVWITLALASGALCWMLQAWVGARWALVGSMLAAISPTVVEGWGQSYWGGGVAMLGGALLFGAVRRLAERPRACLGWTLGAGLAILANSRPWEGLIAAVFAAAGLVLPTLRTTSMRSIVSAVGVPILAVSICTGAWMGYYNYRVTSHLMEMPYQTWYRAYVGGRGSLTDIVRLANPKEPPPRIVRGIRPSTFDEKAAKRTFEKLKAKKKTLMLFHAVFYLPGALLLALAGLPFARRDRWMWLAAGAVATVMVVVFSTFSAWAPHYSAPVAPLIYALTAAGLAAVAGWTWKRVAVGVSLTVAVVVSLFVQSARGGRNPDVLGRGLARGLDRERIVRTLEATPGSHLVIVRYPKNRKASFEMVFNSADIDASRVVWARELGPERTRKLLEYYRDRRAWLVIAEDPVPLRVREYTPYSAPDDSEPM